MLSGKHGATAQTYTIVFLNGATIVGSTPWGGDLPSAKQHAMDHFAINSSQRGATEVVVLEEDDSTKSVLFSYSEGGGARGS
jgi:hypothetical protein